MGKSFYSLIFILFYFQTALSQVYLWPTNSSDKLSATFGEYRSGHYHAGIDIKTNNRIGYPCYAIESGYISRVVTRPYGYGKAVYLKLDDGHHVVYAHLDGFAAKLDSVVRQEQTIRGRYSINKYFKKDELPVKKGDIIAYTGDTGTRHPHLHFEIRDANHNPVNPLQFEGLSVKDNTKPLIKKIAIVPVSGRTLLNNSPENLILTPVVLGNGRYSVRQPVAVNSDFAIEISTYDIVKGLWNKYGPARIDMYLNDSLCFSNVVDQFSYSNTGLITLDRNFQLMAEDKGRFIRMWRFDEAADFPFYKTKTNGIIAPATDQFMARLEVFDFNDNKTSIDVKFIKENIVAPHILAVEADSTHLHCTIERDTLTHLYRQLDLAWVTGAGAIIKAAKMVNFTKTDTTYRFSTELKEGLILQISGISIDSGNELYSFYNPAEENSNNDVTVDYIHNTNSFVTQLTFVRAPSKTPQLFLQNSNSFKTLRLIPLTPVKYISADNSFSNWDNIHTLEVRDNDEIIKRMPVSFKMITAKDKGEIEIENFRLNYNREFVYDTLMVTVYEDHDFINGKFNLLSGIFTITPDNQLLKNSGEISINYPDSLNNIQQAGVYSLSSSRAHFAGAIVDTSQKTISANISGMGSYALLRDDIAPIIEDVYPAQGLYYKRNSVKKLKATIDDKLSKIAGETAIAMKLDNKTVIAEWHPIHKTLEYHLEAGLSRGRHTLFISVTDNAGNRNEKTIEFYIVD